MSAADWLVRFKPATSARTHLLAAGLLWSIVGTALLYFGSRWVLASNLPARRWFLAVSVLAGVLKARFILDRAAERVIRRIRSRGDGQCIGGFFSARTWLLVILMGGTGRLLRGGVVARPLVGLLYAAVGTALLIASRKLWSAWFRHHVVVPP